MSSAPEHESPQPQAGGGEREFAIHKIYVKDVSLETPRSPAVFTEEWRPDVNLNLSSAAQPLGGNAYEVVLVATVDVKLGEKTAFLVEVHQGGVFHIRGFKEAELGHMLGSYCPNILFPYAREAVSDLVVRGGFPQLILAPVNFDALYAQHLQQEGGEQVPASRH
jgi:preprotein translocase subunit SecB